MSFMLLGILNAQATGGGAGAFDLLETTTLTSSASSVTFSGLDAYSDYKHLQIRMVLQVDTTNTNLYMQMNSDTGANYSWHALYGNGSSVASTGAGSQSYIRMVSFVPYGTTAEAFASSVIEILDFSNSNKNTTTRSISGNAGTPNRINLDSGSWQNTAAVTSIKLDNLGNNFVTGSRFSLYGVR